MYDDFKLKKPFGLHDLFKKIQRFKGQIWSVGDIASYNFNFQICHVNKSNAASENRQIYTY